MKDGAKCAVARNRPRQLQWLAAAWTNYLGLTRAKQVSNLPGLFARECHRCLMDVGHSPLPTMSKLSPIAWTITRFARLILERLVSSVKDLDYKDESIVSNIRHYEALNKANESIQSVTEGLSGNIPSDLLTVDIRSALHYLGEITGEITTDEILGNIFGKFCIGK